MTNYILYLYYSPIEDTVGVLAELVKEGKIKYIGLSECSAATLRRAYKVHPIAAVQVRYINFYKKKKSIHNSILITFFLLKIEYSPWSLDVEANGIIEACHELGVTVVAYSPLGRGFLSVFII